MVNFFENHLGLTIGILLVVIGLLAQRFPQLLPTVAWTKPERRKFLDLKGLKRHTLHGYALTALTLVLTDLLPLPEEYGSIIRMCVVLVGVLAVTTTADRFDNDSDPLEIRPENPGEFADIREFTRNALYMSKNPDTEMYRLADRLRTSEGYIPELALVATWKGNIVGHLMLSGHELANGTPVLILTPLVFQGEKIGTALIQEAIVRATERGCNAILVIGPPDFYRGFGFLPSVDLGIRNTNGIPDENILVRELTPGALGAQKTTITF